MKEFALVISMWGHTGAEWQFIDNQSILTEALSQEYCQFLSHEEMRHREYMIHIKCYPTEEK